MAQIDQFYLKNTPQHTSSFSSFQPTQKELSAYLSGQLSLFPKDSGTTLLQWNRSKVDFIELSIALFESNSLKAKDPVKLTKKELIQILMWFFNVPIARWESSLTAAKNRKIEKESAFIRELAVAFSNYVQQN
jgi:hypothetical protein